MSCTLYKVTVLRRKPKAPLNSHQPITRRFFPVLEMAYSEQMSSGFRGKSLREVAPALSEQWHPTKNGESTPDNTSSGANRKAWWICSEGHEWESVIASRVREKLGCSYCSGRYVLPGFSDLATKNPALASEWHPTKNGDLDPSAVPPSGSQKAWWMGSCGHEWEASVNSRARGSGCPYCANQRVLQGFNDLATRQPDLLPQWHPNRNSGLDPTMVIAGSNKKFWWLCDKGHEWEASPNHRKKAGCGTCSGQILLPGFNDLETKYPETAAKWHPTKNHGLLPSQISPSSKTKFWWLCREAHEWEAVAYSQVYAKTSGCPVCSGHKVVPGVNDLETTDPELVKEWHLKLNLPLTPNQFTRGTRRKVWWTCRSGHEWEAIIANRTVSGNKCPYCQHQWVLSGENDLETLAPKLASEWHPSRNHPLTPRDVFATSGKKYWWICKSGHEWDAKVSNRRNFGLGCPICSNQRLLAGYNDLETLNPELASEWHPTKNGNLTSSQVPPNSDLKPWWLGPCGHEWKANVGSRNIGGGCPKCAKGGFDQTSPGYLYLLRKEHLNLQQFGISNVPEKRIARHKKNGWELLDVIGPADGLWILQTETALKRFFRERGLLLPRDYPDKFDGFSESWQSSTLAFTSISRMLDMLRQFEDADASSDLGELTPTESLDQADSLSKAANNCS